MEIKVSNKRSLKMNRKEVVRVEADTLVTLGKINKVTGKPYLKQLEGYLIGHTALTGLHIKDAVVWFIKTNKGNVGLYGRIDLNRKLQLVTAGTYVRITSIGLNEQGTIYLYKVEYDSANTIELNKSRVKPALAKLLYKEFLKLA